MPGGGAFIAFGARLRVGGPHPLPALSLMNISEVPRGVGIDRYGVPAVLVRGEDGKPVGLSKERVCGDQRTMPLALLGAGAYRRLMPGDGFGYLFPLSAEYDMRAPGRYTILAGIDNRVAPRLTLVLADNIGLPGHRSGEAIGAAARAPAEKATAPAASEPDWDGLLARAGKPRGGRAVEAVISRYSPRRCTWSLERYSCRGTRQTVKAPKRPTGMISTATARMGPGAPSAQAALRRTTAFWCAARLAPWPR